MRFYIDESGHTGDVVNSGTDLDFAGQPYFVLASVGIADQGDLERELMALRKRHGIGNGELKSSEHLHHEAFVSELIDWLCMNKAPILVEVVDKRFYLCTHMVIATLARHDYEGLGPHGAYLLSNQAADALSELASDEALEGFIEACISPTDHSLMTFFGRLLKPLISKADASLSNTERFLKEVVIDAGIRYKIARDVNPQAHLDFLPSPDLAKRRQPVWMLPNQTSLANLYARINLVLTRKLADVTLVHDEQQQYARTLLDSLKQAERVGELKKLPFTPYADYRFVERAQLEFSSSKLSAGVQVADIIAGLIMRFYRDRKAGRKPSDAHRLAFEKIFDLTTPAVPLGINQVLPTKECIFP
ncbi:DUF3800 domain-containing protein [Stenotrophomonas sp. GD03701]|jgi:hypothetical protein|uniref:DUF3800 domain-containing protein n=1 Tax=Stenotrophomonas maltophilia TaxID=40324 RepID=A0A2J0SND9_STEMA|nr:MULTISPECIES: DUF3800 domain-containing protein [Stenotrophomonas]MBA0310546.1 DUF3800 domain-containing protein [Stenotrophomonas maltophilia]MCW6027141.1 DUF3800 domain-containing protein [Stenotrophomonas sp. SRS1]MDH1387438.1 DUF3800 domain-containing protein [Stenotrophomonas sp. GD03701]MDH1392353.1 DUF3800 domain-containing protein [Stenotrophomonas sp. GD03702]MDQ7300966.1 DUF3800 domain-containing protein [Stenotrophomonas sp. Sm0581]